ncbi:hypothetical protein HYU18_04425 [Candidatus Woesearchaeota archaeon]|nr:hypothetical protein [Candidatus Woesearchaeota archaeon]
MAKSKPQQPKRLYTTNQYRNLVKKLWMNRPIFRQRTYLPAATPKLPDRMPQPFQTKAKKNKAKLAPYLVAAAAALFAILAFNRLLVGLLTAAFLIAFALLPALVKRKMEGQLLLGPEFNTFGTVIMGIAFGPATGAAFGIVMFIIAATVERGFSAGIPLSLVISALNGLVALPLSEKFGVVTAGMLILTAATIVGNGFIMIFQRDAEINTIGVVGSLFNLAVNYIVFSYLANPILAIIT